MVLADGHEETVVDTFLDARGQLLTQGLAAGVAKLTFQLFQRLIGFPAEPALLTVAGERRLPGRDDWRSYTAGPGDLPICQETEVPRAMADTLMPSRGSITGRQGTKVKPGPSSIIA